VADRPANDRRAVKRRRRVVPIAVVALVAAVSATVGVVALKTRPAAQPERQPAASSAAPEQLPPPPEPPPPCVPELSTRQKLAQLLMVGVRGAADARAVVTDHGVGGIFIGSWTDLTMLQDGSLAEIAAAAGPLPLAVSVDEEGGRVQRLSSLIGWQPAPRALATGATPDEVYRIALDRGRQMRNLGITIDFAPVVDVTDAPGDTVIGDRSFGSDAAQVTEYAGAYARGLRDAGVLPVLKHFPGHGRPPAIRTPARSAHRRSINSNCPT
jgi:beta-N-acetylhexosaminidase